MEAGKKYMRTTDENGVSIYSHLTDVLASLLETQSPNALDAFESVSLDCKKKSYVAKTYDTGVAPPELPDPSAPAAPVDAWAAATSAMLAGVAKPSEEEPSGVVSNVCAESKLFECAGVGLSSDETYRVYAGLVALQKAKDLGTVKFFGKVLGTPGDYYIAEATYNTPPDAPEEEPPPPPGPLAEASGVGCNKYVYFAASDPSGEWTALPDVTPLQITCSKRIRKYLTGSLEADVRAYPPFPGQEKEYLRALVARIVAATTLCPVGKFAAGEEPTDEPTEAELGDPAEGGRTLKAAAELGAIDGWCTRYMGILDLGRTTNLEIEEEDEEVKAKLEAALQPIIPALGALSADEWTAATYSHGGPAVAIAKSLKFPGAFNAYQVAKGNTEVNSSLYIGYGLERLTVPFAMEAPPPFEEEPAEVHEQADMPLEEENKAFLAVKTAEIAEEAAALPDPEE